MAALQVLPAIRCLIQFLSLIRMAGHARSTHSSLIPISMQPAECRSFTRPAQRDQAALGAHVFGITVRATLNQLRRNQSLARMASHCRNQTQRAAPLIVRIRAHPANGNHVNHVNRLKQKSQPVSSGSIQLAEKTKTEPKPRWLTTCKELATSSRVSTLLRVKITRSCK